MAQLKINDLSVGDWVLNRQGVPTKVQVIVSEGNMRCGEDAKPEHSVHIWVSDVEPIPITPEILEKNGFSHNGNKWYTPELFTLERWSKGWSIVIACSCGDYVCEVCTIKYVHQLQHALRLAGVEKEIEL